MSANHNFERGRAAGATWAKTRATSEQLENLATFDADTIGAGVPDAFGWAGVVWATIHADEVEANGVNRADVEDFWRTWDDADDANGYPRLAFLRGFVEGAQEAAEAVTR